MPNTPPRPKPATPDMAVLVIQLCCISLMNFIVFCCASPTSACCGDRGCQGGMDWLSIPLKGAPPTICTALGSLGSTLPPAPPGMPGRPPPMPGKLMMSSRTGFGVVALVGARDYGVRGSRAGTILRLTQPWTTFRRRERERLVVQENERRR